MPTINEVFPGKTFTATAAEFEGGGGLQLTISHAEEETMEDGKKKLGVHFINEERRLICNKTNFAMIANLTGEKNSDNWSGKVVELFNDPNVRGPSGQYGGVRVRAAKQPIAGEMDDADNIPF